jgi:hypothetical protein
MGEDQLSDNQAVEEQLQELEEQSASNEDNKQGSTNEIQPYATDEGITQ